MENTQKRIFTLGMNIPIFVQTTLNAKRKKRRGKKVSLSSKPKLPRVVHILKTGKLKERTHYREVDPYWGVMWRQYEYLRYMEIYLKKIISSAIDNGTLDLSNETDYEIYESYITLLKELTKHKKKLVHWLFNALHIQIGGVLSSRFYGWKEYSDKFVGRFYEIAADLIQKLRFDIDKTRCSVYFYQAFWLGGLSVVNEIRQRLYNEKSVTPNFNRGSKIFSLDDFEDIDNIDFISQYVEGFSDYTHSTHSSTQPTTIDEELPTTTNPDLSTSSSSNKSVEGSCELDSNEIILSNEELDTFEATTNTEYDEHDEYQLKLKAIDVLRKILQKANIPLNILYGSNSESRQNNIIKIVASRIKKKLQQKEIQLTNEEKQILSLYLGRIIN